MPSLDDQIRSVLDRFRVALSGQLEADLTVSIADILRAVADEQRQAISDAEERAAGEARLETQQQLADVRADFDRERDVVQQSAMAEIEGLERTLGEVRDQLDVARRALDEMQSARDQIGSELAQVKRAVEDGRSDLERLRVQLEKSLRFSAAFRNLTEATSLGEILDRLAQAACQETGRTAVFLTKGGSLRRWRTFGFDGPGSIVGAEFDSHALEVVGRAARLGTGQHRNGDATGLPAFATDDEPREAVALPVQVGGSVIAVLYADAARADKPDDEPEWLEMVEALARHAGRMLEAMTVKQAAALWTPRGTTKLSSHGGGERLLVGGE